MNFEHSIGNTHFLQMLPLSLWLQDTDAFSWFLNRIQAQNRENFSLLSKSICVVLDSSEDFEFSFLGG